jgi:hypothetical protein
VKSLETELKDLRTENDQIRVVNNRLEQELDTQQRMGVQIQEIIQFVADGKERMSLIKHLKISLSSVIKIYLGQELLQDVTSRLAGELESFKRGLSQQTPQNNASQDLQTNGCYANTPTTIAERYLFLL